MAVIDQSLLVEQIELRIISESIDRIKKCLRLIQPEELWKSPNEQVLSIGVSILHLGGNAKQWLSSIIEGKEVERDRFREFNPENKFSKSELLFFLDDLASVVKSLGDRLQEADLSKPLVIQGISTNGVGAIVHAIEHFSYHTGQITLMTKLFSKQATNYYADYDLDE